jgi:2-amino-4-hydroxy-6-hydroxymethyldihydropteridine diphosphokinase
MSPVVSSACIGVGSNLDDPERQVRRAIDALARIPHSTVAKTSRLFRTAPWGDTAQPDFVNAAVELETSLSPRELLDAMLAIERAHGRRRDGSRWGPRVIDLDVLLYGDCIIDEPGLRVPHPRLAERAFALLPLADLDADRMIPGVGRVRDLIDAVDARGCEALDRERIA